MEGPPEMVEGMVMKVMTSCSLRPARRARKPPIAWMPSWELPAMRMTASEMFETLGPPSGAEMVASLMRDRLQTVHTDKNCDFNRQRVSSVARFSLTLSPFMSNSYLGRYQSSG